MIRMRSFLLSFAVLFGSDVLVVLSYRWYVPSLAEYFSPNSTESFDGLQINFSRQINTWNDLKRVENEPVHVIEGSVLLTRRGVPFMFPTHNKADAISLRRWLKVAGVTGKAVKLNIAETRALEPTFRQMFSSKSYLRGPVWIHADVAEGPNHRLAQPPVDASLFVSLYKKHFPYGTLSVGWRTSWSEGHSEEQEMRYTWRNVFSVLDHVNGLPGNVNFVVHDTFVGYSLYQLLWLLGADKRYSVTVEIGNDYSRFFDGLAMLRKYSDRSRVFYNFEEQTQMDDFSSQFNYVQSSLRSLKPTSFNRQDWRVLSFSSRGHHAASIVPSDRAVAFLGGPLALLLSERTGNYDNSSMHQIQRVKGRILFVERNSRLSDAKSGLRIHLVQSIDNLYTHHVRHGVHITILANGRLTVEHGRSRIQAQIDSYECYDFEVIDSSRTVELEMRASKRCTGRAGGRRPPTNYQRISLDVLEERDLSKYVLLQKAGDDVNVVVEELVHSGAALHVFHLYSFICLCVLLFVL